MPSVDVDVTAIPDMIEAQLTLSYNRLTHLVRLIVDQGNGHDVDIDKLTSRIDALTMENDELRKHVESLMAERFRNDEMQNELDAMRQELSRLSNACAENKEWLDSSTKANQQQFIDLEQSLKKESDVRTNDLDQAFNSIRELQEFNRAVEQTMSFFNSFIAMWESQPDRVEPLTRCGPDGGFEHSTTERVEYLHSLPAFAAVFDELEVMRQMLRHQASDALTAKNVAGAIRRVSAAEAAASPTENKATAFDRSLLDKLQISLNEVEKRVTTLETRRIPAIEDAQRQQQQQASDTTESNNRVTKLADRLQQTENRLHNLTFQASDGASLEKALLTDIEERVRALENTVEGIPFATNTQQLQVEKGVECAELPVIEVPQRPLSAQRQRPASAKRMSLPPPSDATATVTVEEASPSSAFDTRPMSGKGEFPELPITQRKGGSARPVSPRHSVHSSVEQPNVEAYRRQSTVTPGSPSQVQVLEQDDGLRRRVAQLEENSAILEMKKADRRELAQLEEAVRLVLQNPMGMQAAALGRSLMPQRPMSQADMRLGYAPESAYATPSLHGPRSAPPGRPMFVGGTAHHLRDASGNRTSATISPSHLQ
ncbi:hypothetical protein DQ04_00481060 [Trypanosoma grayi]|uniref:hypothetical protein n=1 Tax=Trypanosoma grayi TaxID=71804 RepID=UPI0004F46FA4|nr:hypothetical protein DQ04_00481060 [Trypanosoma grayi]KEG14411.1 hypothetical protein DQ04_00481060 [Trypanosoma grayi]